MAVSGQEARCSVVTPVYAGPLSCMPWMRRGRGWGRLVRGPRGWCCESGEVWYVMTRLTSQASVSVSQSLRLRWSEGEVGEVRLASDSSL